MAATGGNAEAVVLAEVPALRDAIVRRSLKDAIAERIIGLIASGILQPGDTLPGERELASSLSVSRATMRGALQLLAARGILSISHGARTRVLHADVGPVTIGLSSARAVNAYDINSVHAARLLVEREVVRQAAGNIDRKTLAMLDGLLGVQKHSFEDPVGFLISDREFHVAIYRASGNDLLADFVTDLYFYMMEYRRVAVGHPEAIARSYDDHSRIVEALRIHDAEAAVEAFGAHTMRIYETTQTAMGSRNG